MIEYEGWIFDFENMDCLTPSGDEHKLMRLNDVMYMDDDYWSNFQERKIHCWRYLYNVYSRASTGDTDGDRQFSRRVHQLYLDWCIEKELLD